MHVDSPLLVTSSACIVWSSTVSTIHIVIDTDAYTRGLPSRQKAGEGRVEDENSFGEKDKDKDEEKDEHKGKGENKEKGEDKDGTKEGCSAARQKTDSRT
jgi:hypothetical protein